MKALEVIRTEGWRGFIKRWKTGIEQTSPLQQIQSQIVFTRITLLGIALGFIVSIYNAKSFWWLAIILGAAYGNTWISLIALNQKSKILKQFECKEVENV